MSARVIVTVIGLFTLCCVLPARLPAAPPAGSAFVSFGSFSEREGALFVAEDQGFFRKYGLDIKLVHVRSGPVGLSALSAGETQFYNGSVTGTTLGAAAGGLDMVFIAGLINKLTGAFVVNPAIKSPADLKGKQIGVQSMGGGIWMFTMLVFDHWGLDPKRDKINFRVLGDETVLAQAVANRVIDGSYLSYTFASLLERQGFRVLADTAKLGIPYQGTGIMAKRSYINAAPDTAEKFLRALVESIRFIQEPANKARATKSLAKGLHLSRVEDAAEGYGRMAAMYERKIYPNIDGIRNAIRLLGTVNEKIRRLKAEELVEDRFIRKIESEGGL